MAIQKISSTVIGSGAVTSEQIATGAITAADIPDGEIAAAKLADQAVTPAKLHNTLDLSSKTVTLPTDGISGNSIHGGVISAFASTGIDDNATGNVLTITSGGNVGIGTTDPSHKLHVVDNVLIYGNDAAGNEIRDWPTPSLNIRRTDSHSAAGIRMISLGYKDDSTYLTGSTVHQLSLWNYSGSTPDKATSDSNTELRIDGPGPISLGAGGSTRWLTVLNDGTVLLNGSSIKLPTGTSDPASPIAGSSYFNTTDKTLKIYDGSSWGSVVFSPLGSQQNPAESAAQIYGDNPASPDGVYYIDTGSGSGAVATYCMMTWGGYMLAAKIDSNQDNNWAYSGSYWSTSSPVNESSTSNINAGDAINRIYYEHTMTTGMRISLGNATSNYLTETSHPVGKTAKASFTTNGSSNNGRSNFLTWMQNAGTSSSEWDNQPNCNHIGFNLGPTAAYALRWGISMNNEGDCSSNDAAIGVGTYTNDQYTTGSGLRNVNAGGHRWSPDARYPHNCWIWVK